MRKAAIFASGVLTGTVALPLAVVYVKPVRNTAVLAVAAVMSFAFVSSAEARESGRKHAQKFIDILNDMDVKYNTEEGK